MQAENFKQRRFRTAAAHYLDGRPAYPERLIRRVAALVGLDREDRVMDLGCGPGQLARAFAPYVREVVAVDPEPEMLRVAQEATGDAGTNIEWRQASSTDLSAEFGRFRLVCMGRSFHWMDRPETLRRLDALIEPGGAVALFHDTHPKGPENAWYHSYRALTRQWSGDDRAGNRFHGPDWIRHESILLGSAFSDVEEIGVYERRPVTAEALVQRALSMSSTSRARLGEQADIMVAAIRANLPPEPLSELLLSQAILAFRPPPALG